MPSSISSSEPPTVRAGRSVGLRYTASLLLLIAIGLSLSELLVRTVVTDSESLTLSQAFVLKLLSSEASQAAIGDSRVGFYDSYPPYLFLGRGGLTPWEIEQVVKVYFRDKPIGRVMIESGPQMVAFNRQYEWRTLARYSLVRQVFPFDIFIFEPEFLSVIERTLKELAIAEADGAVLALEAMPDESEVKRAQRIFGEFQNISNHTGQPLDFSQLPADARSKLTALRVRSQRPVWAFTNKLAWRSYADLVRWLVSKGGNVCLVRTPFTREYEARMNEVWDEWRFGSHSEAVTALAAELGIPYVDYHDIGLGSLPLAYFENQDHLNQLGHAVYWPTVEDACFEEPRRNPMMGRNGLLLFKLDLVNSGFDATAGTGVAPSGWRFTGGRARPDLGAVMHSAAEPRYGRYVVRYNRSFGVDPDAARKDAAAWSVGKRFGLRDVSRIMLKVMVFPSDPALPEALPEVPAGSDFFARNDAYFRIAFYDAAGAPIPLSPYAEYSPTAGRHRLLSDPIARARNNWWELTHVVDVPPGAESFEAWIVATGGRNVPAPVGQRRSGAAILLDEFQLLADGQLDETTGTIGRASRGK